MRYYLILIFISMACLPGLYANAQQSPPYQDLTHESQVFGHPKYYRLYLPDSYKTGNKKYPVVYFFHGWGGRHFKDDNAKLDYVKLAQLVNKYQVIMVMLDGNITESEPRPYNVGYHEDVKFTVQMKDYFPELVGYIDSTYRTLTDRQHRGIIGFSMGGIMSLYLGGKYPDMVSAVVSMMGSPEFFIGSPQDHTLYSVRYNFKNLREVHTRMQTSKTDILFYLNEEVRTGAAWEGGLPLGYQRFKGGHMVDKTGKIRVFETAMRFITKGFAHPLPTPATWSHYDLYPSFNVWGYGVESNKQQPGFLFLRNVDKYGFGLYSYQWLPDGPLLDVGPVKITTAPIYHPAHSYQVVAYSVRTGKVEENMVNSDTTGRLQITLPSAGAEIGIHDKEDAPAFICLDYKVADSSRFLRTGVPGRLTLRLLNRGGEKGMTENISVHVHTTDKSISIPTPDLFTKTLQGQRILTLPPLDIVCNKIPPSSGAPWQVKLQLAIHYGDQVFNDELTIPVWFNVPVISNFRIDDGVAVRDTTWGSGNGNGIAEAGERIMLYKDSSRLRLYTEDPWVIRGKELLADEIIPARWPDGYTVSSVIQIAPDCPDGHEIDFLTSYETKTFNPINRKVTWGKIKLTVRNK